jgi:excinuclease ABC subunit B
MAYNQQHNITPRSVVRAWRRASIRGKTWPRAAAVLNEASGNLDVTETVRELEEEMLTAANS